MFYWLFLCSWQLRRTFHNARRINRTSHFQQSCVPSSATNANVCQLKSRIYDLLDVVLFQRIIKDMQAHPVAGCQGCTSNSSFYKELPYLMRSHQGQQGTLRTFQHPTWRFQAHHKGLQHGYIHLPIYSYTMAIPSIACTLDSDKSWPEVGDSLLIHALKSVLIQVIHVTCHLWSYTLKSKNRWPPIRHSLISSSILLPEPRPGPADLFEKTCNWKQ